MPVDDMRGSHSAGLWLEPVDPRCLSWLIADRGHPGAQQLDEFDGAALREVRALHREVKRGLSEQATATGLWPGPPRQIRVNTRKGF